MGITAYIKNIILSAGTEGNILFAIKIDSIGMNLVLPQADFDACQLGAGGAASSYQYAYLKILEEQDLASRIANGFTITHENIVLLEDDAANILNLYPRFHGTFAAIFEGQTGQSAFSVQLILVMADGTRINNYKHKGAFLEISSEEIFQLTHAEWLAFDAIRKHLELPSNEKTGHRNLQLIFNLQVAKHQGMKIKLSHFDNLNVFQPDDIGVSVIKQSDGSLLLTPVFGGSIPVELIDSRLGQLNGVAGVGSIRIGDQIVVLDEKRLSATREVLENRKINKSQVKKFLKNPTAYLDAKLVDLDGGFSYRVHGATVLKHAYFGETDKSEIDWFNATENSSTIQPISKILPDIVDEEDLRTIEILLNDAQRKGATEITYKGKIFDICTPDKIKETLSRANEKIISGESAGADDQFSPQTTQDDNKKIPQQIVVDIDLNDDDLKNPSETIKKTIKDILYPVSKLDWSNYSRSLYQHQEDGIGWILGLALGTQSNINGNSRGSLLADDMGLGKTLMALSAIDQLYKITAESNKSNKVKPLKPCLVVAPLSVMQNWKDEVDKTFHESPFIDIILLQTGTDLKHFRENSIAANPATPGNEIRFTLKVGSDYGTDRLDLPRRLVITTYQTLRDHQFSLCLIDWGMVIFDEAQAIKNPNIIQTRAAKGLKADFKLLVTGTPVENTLADFWCLMDTACPGHLGSYQHFRETYITPITQAAGDELDIVRSRIGRQLREDVGALMLRRIKEDELDGLPSKEIFVGIKDNEWIYEPSLESIMKESQLKTYNSSIAAQNESESNIVLGTLHRLRDVSLHPQLVDGGVLNEPTKASNLIELLYESGKIESLLSILDKIKTVNEKCIIFAVNKRLQTFLSVALRKYYSLSEDISIINGDTKTTAKRSDGKTRMSLIKTFEDKAGFNIIIMSPIAAGTGLTIIGANHVIHLERHWNPAKEAQATDRVYRIGQKKDVKVYIPILRHPEYESFDVNLHYLLSNKTLLKDAVVTTEQVLPNPGGFSDAVIEPEHIITAKELPRISWQHFEALCAELFSREFNTTSCWLTKNGADHGADVVMINESFGYLIQCKHVKKATYNGYSAIQQVHSAKIIYEKGLARKVGRLIFATNARVLSAKTKEIAELHDVQVISHNEIVSMLKKHNITFKTIIQRLAKERYAVL